MSKKRTNNQVENEQSMWTESSHTHKKTSQGSYTYKEITNITQNKRNAIAGGICQNSQQFHIWEFIPEIDLCM